VPGKFAPRLFRIVALLASAGACWRFIMLHKPAWDLIVIIIFPTRGTIEIEARTPRLLPPHSSLNINFMNDFNEGKRRSKNKFREKKRTAKMICIYFTALSFPTSTPSQPSHPVV
jgi:hypothetical protein